MSFVFVKRSIIVLLAMLSFYLKADTVSIYANKISSENKNGLGNVHNDALAFYDNNIVYFINGVVSRGDTTDCKIYKMLSNGEYVKLSDDLATELIVAEKKLFYITQDGVSIKSMALDGTKVSTIFDENVKIPAVLEKMKNSKNQFNVENLIYNDGSLYFVLSDFYTLNKESEIYRLIVRMNLDGTNIKPIFTDRISQFIINENKIYYTFTEKNGLYVMNLDGSNNKQITKKLVRSPIVDKNYVYFIGKNYYLYKMDLKKKKPKVLLKEELLSFNLLGDTIYYSMHSESRYEIAIRSISIDGNSKRNLTDELTIGLNIAGDWIFYDRRYAEDDRFAKMKIDGTQDELVEIYPVQ